MMTAKVQVKKPIFLRETEKRTRQTLCIIKSDDTKAFTSLCKYKRETDEEGVKSQRI